MYISRKSKISHTEVNEINTCKEKHGQNKVIESVSFRSCIKNEAVSGKDGCHGTQQHRYQHRNQVIEKQLLQNHPVHFLTAQPHFGQNIVTETVFGGIAQLLHRRAGRPLPADSHPAVPAAALPDRCTPPWPAHCRTPPHKIPRSPLRREISAVPAGSSHHLPQL